MIINKVFMFAEKRRPLSLPNDIEVNVAYLFNKLTEKPARESLWASFANDSSLMIVNSREFGELLHSGHRRRNAEDDKDKHHKNNSLWKNKTII